MEKIAFTICYSDESKLQECLYYIKRQIIPDNYEIEIFPIEGAETVAAGYQFAMEQSDARYKVYLKETVLLVRADFVTAMLDAFRDEKLGMIGMIGTDEFCKDGAYQLRWSDVCAITFSGNKGMSRFTGFKNAEERENYVISPAEALDGMLLATQYDVPWDTDAGLDACFDIAHCLGVKDAGYALAVIGNEHPFALYDLGVELPLNLDSCRKVFCEKYASKGYEYGEDIVEGYEEYDKLCTAKKQFLLEEKEMREEALEKGYPTQAGRILETVKKLLDMNVPDEDLYYYLAAIDAYAADMAARGYSNLWPAGELDETLILYKNIKYLLWRATFGCPEEDWSELIDVVSEGIISEEAMSVISRHCTGTEL